MGKVIIPNTYVSDLKTPLIFLAGPIRGAPNWQDKAVEFLLSQEPNLIVASPRRGIRNKIAPYIAKGDENHFSRQREWERYYLDIASKTGAIMFWLPGEKNHKCSKVYGATTRVELGQWMTAYRYDKSTRFCVGSDGNFHELRTIEYDLKMDAPEKEIKKTLNETCIEALRLAYQD